MPKKILIVAGEPSGDLHASNLVKEMRSSDPGLRFFGLGGELSQRAGVDVIFDISKLALVGAVEVLKHLLTVKKAYQAILTKINSEPPDLAILVDYPGFNLRLARELKRRSIPVVYYISPQVWAWGMDRIGIIRTCINRIIVFFKFEEELYKKHSIDVRFAGHPFLDSVKATLAREDMLRKYELAGADKIVALMPGSRESEVKTLLPVMASAARIVGRKLKGVKFVVVKYPDLAINLYEKTLQNPFLNVRVINGDAYNVLSVSDLAVVASGSVTLESAIIGTPIIITYKVSSLTYLLYKIVSRIRFLGLVNIIAGKEIAPELLQYNATPEKIAGAILKILTNDKVRTDMRAELKKVSASLGSPGASRRAADAVLELL